ncbi:MAG TPA: hypothetical protein ENF28_01045 [Proteobacteria bacterium]|nr:hypothetical protein [Pseudomonadota bacterium]
MRKPIPWKKYLYNSRVYSSLVFIPLFIAMLAMAPKWLFFILLISALGMALNELWLMLCPAESKCLKWLAFALSFGLAAAAYEGGIAIFAGFFVLITIVLVLAILPLGFDEKGLYVLGRLLIIIIYLPLLLSHLLLLWDLPDGRSLVAMIFLVTWGGDAFSYYSGTAWGRHKLAPNISPNKTIEGSVGGVIGAGLFSLLLVGTGQVSSPWFFILILGMIANIAGQLGDLFESYLKRFAGLKDSGVIIPGHGGVLDRLDSVLFAVPVIYYGMLVLGS